MQQFTQQIQKTEIEVKRLRREFERYFAGAIDLPPKQLEAQIEKEIRRLRSRAKSSAHRFQTGALEASFGSYRELYNRRVREQEEGRVQRRAAPEEPRHDTRSGILVRDDVPEAAVQALYRDLYGRSDAPAVGQEQFRNYLRAQADQIRERTGCAGIVFRLEDSGGKPRLKARPVKGRTRRAEDGNKPNG